VIIVSSLFVLMLGCNGKKEDKEKRVSFELYPATFFKVGVDLYFSDGKKFYCGFRTWDHFYKLRKTKKAPKRVLEYPKTPSGMILIKYCSEGIISEEFYL
jgi:hypothetical protein